MRRSPWDHPLSGAMGFDIGSLFSTATGSLAQSAQAAASGLLAAEAQNILAQPEVQATLEAQAKQKALEVAVSKTQAALTSAAETAKKYKTYIIAGGVVLVGGMMFLMMRKRRR